MSDDGGSLMGDAYGDVADFVPPGTGLDGRASSLREKRLREENAGLRGQLDSAREIIKGVARGDAADGGKKRLRVGGASGAGGGSGSSSALASSDSDEAFHPATLLADRLRLELEEQRVLREQDKQRFEVVLGEAESAKGKLLRQVKFLSQEEEETRAECKQKQDAFLTETARLQEALSNERAALAEARAESGRMGQLERQGLERRLEREGLAMRVAEDKMDLLEAQAIARTKEVTDLRNLRREVDAENARLRLDLAALKRETGAGATPLDESGTSAAEGSSSSWDTPAARELRAKVKVLEREARKREAMLQELKANERNAIFLEDQVQTLQAQLQLVEDSLKEALAEQVNGAVIRDEKEEWSLVFARVVREEKLAARLKLKGQAGGGGQESEVAAGEGADGVDPRPTPLVALRLLREVQQERSLSVKELTTLRLRSDHSSKRLARVEQELKQEKEGASILQARAEDLRVDFDKLERRCRSAEREVVAQKELIESYERDNFRKPAGEAWLSGHASLEAALSAAKDEAKALREASAGQVSALEAGRLRDRAAEAETALEAASKERDHAVKTAQDFAERLENYEKGAANGTGISTDTKVLHMRDNPSALAVEEAKNTLKRRVDALMEDNKRLVRQLESAGAGAVDASMSMVDGGSILGGAGMKGAETPDVAKFSVRLKEAYKERINYYREAIYLLTGYRIDLMKDPTRQVLRLRSMYAEHESDCLLFQQMKAGLELVETPLALQHMEKIEMFLNKCHSIPAFLSSLTNELFEKQTFMPR